MAQHIVVAPISSCFLIFKGKELSQGPSRLVILLGGAMPKVKKKKHSIPNKLCYMTIKELMLCGFISIAETIIFISFPFPLSQVAL